LFTQRQLNFQQAACLHLAEISHRVFNVLKLFIVCSSCQTFAFRVGVVRNVASCAQTVIAVDLVKAVVIKPARKRGTVVDI